MPRRIVAAAAILACGCADGGGADRVIVRDADGTHIRSAGGKAEGPAEFRFPYNIWRAGGDSIGVYDMGLQRISIWSADGTHGRVVRLTPPFMNEPELVGVLPNGDMLFYNAVLGAVSDNLGVEHVVLHPLNRSFE